MKKLIYLFILTLGIISCDKEDDLSNTSKWEILKTDEYKSLTDIEFYNNNFGVISGSFGTLLKTEDGGENWEELNVKVNHSFLKTFILNENEFFTSRVGIYKTNDKGKSFNELGDLSNFSGSIYAIHFFDSNNGIIYKNGTILKTIDGGKVWNVTYDNAGYAIKMQFVTNNVGFIYGGISYDGISQGELHKSSDKGNTWSQINIQTSEIISLYFLNEQIGYFSNFKNQFFKTLDGGLNWETIGNIPITFNDIIFLDNNLGYGIGNSFIYKTQDGGKTWIKDYENNTLLFTSIAKTPNGKLYCVTNNGMILRK